MFQFLAAGSVGNLVVSTISKFPEIIERTFLQLFNAVRNSYILLDIFYGGLASGEQEYNQ